MQIKVIKTKIFNENEDLLEFILKYIKKIPENSVLVITSKIVALSEGRTAICKNKKEKIKIIKKESSFSIKTKYTWLTIKDNIVMASAGIDESNANGKVIFLPKNSFYSAEFLRKKLINQFNLKNLGILITDSRLMPLRAGVVGVALGYAGFKGIKSYIGKKDIFGRKLKMSRTDIADSLATSSVLCMGEGKEQQPLAIITEAPIIFVNKIKKDELIINPKDDLYAPFFQNLKKLKN
jgi:F420-0:gamma-glutamyl ligase